MYVFLFETDGKDGTVISFNLCWPHAPPVTGDIAVVTPSVTACATDWLVIDVVLDGVVTLGTAPTGATLGITCEADWLFCELFEHDVKDPLSESELSESESVPVLKY